jgi:hypothetical protein
VEIYYNVIYNISQWDQEFSLLNIVQNESGAQPALVPVVKRPGREADH